MKGLKTLIRLQKRELDELRRQQKQVEEKRDQLLARMQELKDELHREIAAYEQLTEMRTFFGDFSESIKQRQARLMKEVMRLEQHIQNLTSKIRVQFGELKKYEISYDRQMAALKKEREQREQRELDEVGIRGYLRQQQEEPQSL